MADLRRDAENRLPNVDKGYHRSPKENKKKKKEKEKKEKKAKEVADNVADKKRRLSSDCDDLEPSQKGLTFVFGGTALDPRAKERKKILRKARKLGRKKRKKKQSSSES